MIDDDVIERGAASFGWRREGNPGRFVAEVAEILFPAGEDFFRPSSALCLA